MYKVFFVFFFVFTGNIANASIVDFNWSNGWQDILTGYVDTEKNSLFITQIKQWTPGENHYINPLQPDLSDIVTFNDNVWQLKAINLDGSDYDIEDNWSGILGGSWGFSSDIAISDVAYLNGNYIETRAFKSYMSIGISKVYFPAEDQFDYYAHGESYLNSDGSYYSQLSSYAAYYSAPLVPNNINEFPNSVLALSSGGSHTISHRVEVPEPSILTLFVFSVLFIMRKRRELV